MGTHASEACSMKSSVVVGAIAVALVIAARLSQRLDEWRDDIGRRNVFRSITRVSLILTGLNPRKQWWEVDKSFEFEWRGKRYTVPVGMDTDGASIPRWFLSLIGGRFDSCVISAALAHDYFYASGVVSRLEADWMFFWALKAHGTGFCRRWLMFGAVALFGWIVWCSKPERRWAFAGPATPCDVDLDDHDS